MKRRCILSITTSGHGVGGAVCIDGKIVAANTLERITREKYDILLPLSMSDLKTFGWNGDPRSYVENVDLKFDLENDYSSIDFGKLEKFGIFIDHLLKAAGIQFNDIECVAYSYRYNEQVKEYFRKLNSKIEFIVPEHHFAHACQAFLPSPFEEAAIMVIDGQGVPLARTNFDPLAGCLGYGKGNRIDVLYEIPVRNSIGDIYAEFTRKVGFKTNEEGKTMGLAPYGTDAEYQKIRHLVEYDVTEFSLRDMPRLIRTGLKSGKHPYRFGDYRAYLSRIERRAAKGEYTDLYKDLAYASQAITEDVMIKLANWLHEKTGSYNLCISGGVGLNCVANYKVLKNTPFKNIFVYPNAGDNGLPAGQALYVHSILDGGQRVYVADHDYLGREYSASEVKAAVETTGSQAGISIEHIPDPRRLCDVMARGIADGKITSWWQGRSEWGPRALGNRSILADPRGKDTKDILNSRVKHREAFRPFTPSVLKERSSEYFDLDIESPFMLIAPQVKPGKADVVPAITHVDNTARVQTVSRDVNERYYDLISAFDRITGVPVVLDTSFNVAGEPIVETPEDAIRCFLSTDIDMLGVGDYILRKNKR